MGWGNILGTIGGIASGAGGLIGGDVGGILQGIGSAATLGGSAIAGSQAAQQGQAATAATTEATNAALGLAQAQDKRSAQAYTKAMGMIPQVTGAYTTAEAALGPQAQMDPNAVAARANQLLPQYMKEADQSMQQMESTDIGNLMKAGIDTSTFGVQTRGMLAAKGADLHQQAYNKAYDDALNYVKTLTEGQVATRKEALTEATAPYDAALTAYEDLYGKTPSSIDATKTALTGAGQLASQASVGAQAAAQGASQANANQSFGNFLTGVKDIWGNLFGTNDANTVATYAYTNPYGGTMSTGADY